MPFKYLYNELGGLNWTLNIAQNFGYIVTFNGQDLESAAAVMITLYHKKHTPSNGIKVLQKHL